MPDKEKINPGERYGLNLTETNATLAAMFRFVRTLVPQIPAGLIYLTEVSGTLNLPAWVVPLAAFLGVCVTAFDKFARDMKWY
jgi:hypothetical protein